MSVELPDGWTRSPDPTGRLGADTVLHDETGAFVGSYGWVGSTRANPASRPHWECSGRRMASEQACIDELVRRRRA